MWATPVGDVVVSFVQSDLDAVGAYGGGVRAAVEFLTPLPECLLWKRVVSLTAR